MGMSVEALKTFLLWSFLFNYALLAFWSLILVVWRDRIYLLQSHFFPMPKARFDACHFFLLSGYKLAIIGLNLIPWLALHMVI
jgi:hypothetical protein